MLRRLRTESYKKGVVFSVLFSAFAKLLAFASSAVIALYFGAGAEADVYFFALLVISSLAYYVTGLNSAVLIPEYMHLREISGEAAGEKFLNFFVFLYAVLGAAVSAVLI
ncbi:MAG TPA: hypothetical protein PLL10_08800, partial [Elusimicrobiales bacterium]|nr:hypothetical protein [Elusimicrobiales bacterium]